MNYKQSGIALVIVIWVLSLLTIMAGSFALTMRRETTVISAVKDNAALLAAAETGINIAQQMMILEDENQRWRADGSIYEIRVGDAEIRVRLLAEAGKVDLNKADEVLLTKVLSSTETTLDQQQALVSAIIDWRDKDDLVRINGAEKGEYEQAGLSYSPPNKPFQLIQELRMVLGMDETIYRQLQFLVTVYSGQSGVNLALAGKEVLQAIGQFPSEILDEYLRQRKENFLAQLPPPPLPQLDEEQGQNKEQGQMDIEATSAFTIIAQSKINDRTGTGIQLVVKTNNSDQQVEAFQIVDWQQIYQDFSLFSEEMTQHLITAHDESEFYN